MKKISICVSLIFLITSSLFSQLDSIPLTTVVQKGHQKPINCSSISYDGNFIITGSKDNVVKLWDVNHGFEIRSFYRHTNEVRDVAFSHNDKFISSVGADNKVYVYNVKTGKLIQSFNIKIGDVWQVAFSYDDSKIITSATRGSLCVWDIQTGNLIKEYKKSYSGDINNTWLNIDNTLASITSRDELDIINFETLDTISKINLESVYSYSFHPKKKILAVGSTKLETHLIDIETSKVTDLLVSDTEIRCNGCNTKVLYSNSGKYLASGTKSNGISVWNTKNNKLLTNHQITNGLKYLEFSTDDKYLIISTNESVKVIDIINNDIVYQYSHSNFKNFKPHFIPFKNQIVIPTSYNTFSKIDFIKNKTNQVFQGYSNYENHDGLNLDYANWVHSGLLHNISMKTSIAVSPINKWIAKGNIDSTVFLIDLFTGTIKKKLLGHSSLVYRLKFSKDGKYLATGGGDRFILVWDTKTWKQIGKLEGHVEKIFDFDFSNDNKYLISSGWDGRIITWDLSQMKSLHFKELKSSAYTVGFTTNDLYTLNGNLQNGFQVSEFDSKEEYRKLIGHTDRVSSFCFSNSRELFTSSWDGFIRGWDIGSGMILSKYKPHRGAVYSLKYSTKNKILLSGGADNEIVIWDAINNKQIGRLKGHKNPVTSIDLDNDQNYVVSSSADGEVKVWDLKLQKELYTYLQINHDDWLITNPYGYFDGSPNALKYVTYVKGMKAIPISTLFKKYYTPSLAKRIIDGDKFVQLSEDINTSFNNVSKLTVNVSSAENLIMKTDTGIKSKDHFVKYDIKTSSTYSQVHNVQIFKNNKLVKQILMPKGKNTLEKSISIYLHNGVNELKFIAINEQGIESIPVIESVWYDGEQGKTDLFVFAIGINDYQKQSYELNYAVNDAQAFIKNLDSGIQDSLFNHVETIFIKDKKAIKTNVINELKSFSNRIGPEDVFVFFYAGHGVMNETVDESEFYLIMNDVVNMYGDSNELKNKGLSAKELLGVSKSIAAEKQLYILDACQSGGALHAFVSRGLEREKALAQLARSTGTFFLTASQDAQLANESTELKHGMFTYSLLEVMKGQDIGSAKDNKITVSELKTYAEERVPELSKKYHGYVQYPTSYGFGQDFPLIILK